MLPTLQATYSMTALCAAASTHRTMRFGRLPSPLPPPPPQPPGRLPPSRLPSIRSKDSCGRAPGLPQLPGRLPLSELSLRYLQAPGCEGILMCVQRCD